MYTVLGEVPLIDLFLAPGYRTVDALLQRMFEAEIAPEEEGPSLDEILNLSPDEIYPGNPAFDRAV